MDSEGEQTNLNTTQSNKTTGSLIKQKSIGGAAESLSALVLPKGSVVVKDKPSSSNLAIEEHGKFKRPLAPVTKKPRIVLEEDKFVEQLEKIIQRDYFPDLEKLKAQNAYHNAIENNDIHMLRELYSKYSFGATPSLREKSNKETPLKFETPLDNNPERTGEETPTHLPMEARTSTDSEDKSAGGNSSSAKDSSSDTEPTLNSFLSKYTSEDNQSFQEILENSHKKHRIKNAWLFDKEEEHRSKYSMALVVPSMEEQAVYKKQFAVDTWKYTNYNSLMYPPEGAPLTAEEQIQLAKKQPQVVYKNTRFSKIPPREDNTGAKEAGQSHIIRRQITKIGVDGKEIESDTPKVNGYSLVRTPSPTQAVGDESPFLTWGEIEGTPFRLDGSDTPLPGSSSSKPYRMLEQTKREKIAMQLSEKVSERYRDRKLKAIEAAKTNLASPRPRSSLERLSTMSPAAKRLIGSGKFSIGSSRDRALSASYSPQPHGSNTPLLSLGKSPLVKTPKTPLITLATPKSPAATIAREKSPALRALSNKSPLVKRTDLTTDSDGSRKKKPRAADFF